MPDDASPGKGEAPPSERALRARALKKKRAEIDLSLQRRDLDLAFATGFLYAFPSVVVAMLASVVIFHEPLVGVVIGTLGTGFTLMFLADRRQSGS
jgi:hypothetical protein